MKLDKEPVTEMEFFQTIEGLGGFRWSTEHALAHGHMLSTSGVEQDLVDVYTIQARLVEEACTKFNIIHPRDIPQVKFGEERPAAPEGSAYYWDWYRSKQRDLFTDEYNKQVCSACPLSKGIERFISTGGQIPCSVFRGSMYRLRSEERCGMIDYGGWKRDQLEAEIISNSGISALNTFKAKEAELTTLRTSKHV